MCDFAAFRTKARATFSTLIVSVMMFEHGSGKGGEVTMYRVKVAGMAIGEDITCQGPNAEDVLREAVRRVAAARKAKKEADNARDLARRAAADGGQTVQMLVSTGGTLAVATEGEQPLQVAA